MADITLSSRTIIRQYKSDYFGSPCFTADASTCASTATIRLGQVVQFDILTETASHRLIRASTAAGIPNLSTNIAGIAAMSDLSDGSTTMPFGNGLRPITFWPAISGQSFIFPTKIAGVASTLVGTILVLGYDSTLGIHYLDAGQGSSGRVQVTEVLNPGDTNGYVVGRFLSTAVSPSVAPR